MREIKAIVSGKLTIKDNVEEIYEKRITTYGNGAKIDASEKYIGKSPTAENPKNLLFKLLIRVMGMVIDNILFCNGNKMMKNRIFLECRSPLI